MLRNIAVIGLSLALIACSRGSKDDLASLREEFVYQALAFSPSSATQAGYHEHKGARLSQMLDDYSEPALEAQRRFYRDFQARLERAVKAGRLSAEDGADYSLLQNQASLQLLELDEIQNYRHNPTLYVEMIGTSLFNPLVLEYAPKPDRFRDIIGRLEKIPAAIGQAKQNLVSAPEIWTTVALEENDGNLALIDSTLRKEVPSELKTAYDEAAGPALTALRDFNNYLKNELAKRPNDWRLGKEKYAKKFRLALASSRTPEEVLEAAEKEIKLARRQMWDLALPLHSKWFPTHRDPVDLNLIVGEVLDKIAEKRSTPATFVEDAKRGLEEAREFVRTRNLVPLPPRDNLQVIETPEFLRGIYAVAGFAPAPALQPQLGAFYWITPIPKDWPRARIDSKLREYNQFSLKLVAIHEAMPGHYVQLEYSNELQPLSRRILRTVFGSGTYVEGWAVYATEMLLDEGFLDGSPELRLTFLKQQLRMLANAVLDIRLQTMQMSDDEAMQLMTRQCFQETEEATAKLRRAKLSSAQLPTYYVGYRDWKELRAQIQQSRGGNFNLAEFHRQALAPGAAPLSSLAGILGVKPGTP